MSSTPNYVEIKLQDELHPEIKTGLRRFVVWSGRKFVYLFYPATLQTVKLKINEYSLLHSSQVVDFNPVTVRKIIRRNRKQRQALGQFDGGANAKQALKVLKEAA